MGRLVFCPTRKPIAQPVAPHCSPQGPDPSTPRGGHRRSPTLLLDGPARPSRTARPQRRRPAAVASQPTEPAPPWQLAPQPVYAVGSTEARAAAGHNLSIATYVTAASISKGEGEKKKYVVCLFKDSATHGTVMETRRLSLSLLREHDLAPAVVELLGKTHYSAQENDKVLKLSEMGLPCPILWGLPVLHKELAAGALELRVLDTMDAGDHDVLVCQVENLMLPPSQGSDILTTAKLKEMGVL